MAGGQRDRNARQVAFAALLRVEAGAWADEVLRAASANLSPADAALAWHLTLGILRVRNQLDFLIAHFSGKSGKLDIEVRTALRLGLYQLRYLDRIPPHAAVKTSVDLVIAARKRSAAGFVNAVLRKANREPIAWPTAAIAAALPETLWAAWVQQFGVEKAEALALAARTAPATMPEVSEFTPSTRQQDGNAARIVPLLEVAAGHRVLDLCAAPGNKTLQLLAASDNTIACDLHLHRLRQVPAPLRVQLDASQPLPFGPVFDRVLVDAPCSGTGTLARNPEIKWRVNPAQIASLQLLQRTILRNALAVLRPGGRLVYSTCSLEQAENEEVATAMADRAPLEMGYLWPEAGGADGFFHAVFSG